MEWKWHYLVYAGFAGLFIYVAITSTGKDSSRSGVRSRRRR